MKKKEKIKTYRLALNLPEVLVCEVDEYAKKMNLTRTSAITFLLSRSLQEDNIIFNLGKLINLCEEEKRKEEKKEKNMI